MRRLLGLRSTTVTIALFVLVGCDDAPATPRAAPATDDRATDRNEVEAPVAEARVADDACAVVGPASTWLADAPPRGTLAVGIADEAGLLVVMSEAGEVRARALGATELGVGARGGIDRERPSPGSGAHALDLEGASALFALEPMGDGWLVVGRGSCPEGASCLLARRLDPSGAPAGEAVAAALPGPLRTARRVATGDRLYVAWSSDGGHRGLEIFTIASAEPGALGRARRSLGSEPASEELPTEILGLASDAHRWAVVWRRGAPEDARSHVHLTTEDAHGPVEALHEALVLDGIALDGPEVVAVAGFEFSRPHFVRLAPGSPEPLDARVIEAGAAPPPPFAARVRAAVELDPDGLWLRRTNAAGDPIGAPTRVATGDIGAATVVRRGDDTFVVAWIAPTARAVRAAVVRCP